MPRTALPKPEQVPANSKPTLDIHQEHRVHPKYAGDLRAEPTADGLPSHLAGTRLTVTGSESVSIVSETSRSIAHRFCRPMWIAFFRECSSRRGFVSRRMRSGILSLPVVIETAESMANRVVCRISAFWSVWTPDNQVGGFLWPPGEPQKLPCSPGSFDPTGPIANKVDRPSKTCPL